MKRTPHPPQSRAILFFAVFFTNLLSLACQVLWGRQLAYLFGSTAAVFSTVLSIFLLGLALGALVAGRVADQHPNPWRLLAGLEILLGVYTALSLTFFELGRGLYLAVLPADLSPLPAALAKFVVVLLIMIVPTFSIGAAFSVAIRIASKDLDRLGRDVSLVYALDTLGAATGALLAGFVLVPMLGLADSTHLLGIAAVILGLFLWRRSKSTLALRSSEARSSEARSSEARSSEARSSKKKKRTSPVDPPPPPGLNDQPSKLGILLVTFFFSGAAALVLETGWIRFFSLLNGTHVYSSSTVLAGFLAGVGLGSLVMASRIDRLRNPHAVVALLFAAIALGGVLVFRSADLFGKVYFKIHQQVENYYVFQLLVCLVIGMLVALPALAMGANFPLVAKIATRTSEERGFAVGRVFFINSLGAVVGAFVAEFVLLPTWGFSGLILTALIIYGLAALVFLVLSTRQTATRQTATRQAVSSKPLMAPAVACALMLGGAFWLSPVVSSWRLPLHALYYHGLRAGSWEKYQAEVEAMELIDEKQSFYGHVSVVKLEGRHLLLKHNGKTDASTALNDNRTQILLGHLPMLFHPKPRRVLVIGLGGGLTLRALTSHAEAESITQVEIDPQVVAAAREHFSTFARGALDDERVHLVTNDGRNFMDASEQKYDVVVSEPPNIWVAGVSGLFTQEFYRSAEEHLASGGILCQWVPLYELEKDDYHVMMRTMTSVFRHVTFWQIGGDLAILASNQPFSPAMEEVRAKLNQPRVVLDLREIGMGTEETLRFLNEPAARPDQVSAYLGEGTTLNTDDKPVLEFTTARNLFRLSK